MSAPSSPITRLLAAVTSLGTSELAQKKPFQNLDEDRPIGGSIGSISRFIPLGSSVSEGANLGSSLAQVGGSQVSSEVGKKAGGALGAGAADTLGLQETLPARQDPKQKMASREQARVGVENAAKSASDYLAANPLPQTPEEEEAARQRAQRLGRSGSKRASQYLAASPGGL